MSSNEIRIDDLRNPRLSPAQQGALDYFESLPQVELNVEAVLAAARERTGLADFGPEDFRERLALLVDEWGGNPNITNLSRQTLQGYLIRYASSRLQIQDLLKRHPEIHDQRIERPVIVVGLPRSGTTHLVNLLAADSRFHSLPLWESYEPVQPEGGPIEPVTDDPRYQRCAEAWAGMQQVTPLIAAMHPMNPDHIHEDLELMGPDFASYNFEWLAPSPRWRDHYYAHDQTAHYEYMKTGLKILQWQRNQPGKRWVLKCPQHLEQLSVLRQVFPDAIIAITHRDPVAVIQSAVTMQAYTQRINYRFVDTRWLIDYWPARIEHLLRACVRDRALWPEAQSFDVLFHEFMKNDMATVEQIYAKAGIEMTAAARAELDQYIADHPRGKEGKVVYDLRGDFDADLDALYRRFDFYTAQFPVRTEVR